MATFYLKRYDRYPSIARTLTDSTGAPIDLTGCTVKFIMKLQGGASTKVNAAATVVSASAGTVRYDWLAADVDTIGTYDQEWEITYPDTKKMTVPNASYDVVQITADLDGA